MGGTRRKSLSISSKFLMDPYEPSYLALHRSGAVDGRVRRGLEELEDCCACPRRCRINRIAGETRVCGTGRNARVSSAFAHFGEEDCLRGWNGSGTIFFSFCNLGCVFCQNWDISQTGSGSECSAEQIADAMLHLQAQGCHNINFVTPEHVVPQVIEAIAAAVSRGLTIPIVYNTSAYDSMASLKLLDGLIDIYMPDFKFWSDEAARRFLKAKDYPHRAREAIVEMHRQVGPLRFGPDGVARRGLLIRHLVMPGFQEDARAIFQWIARDVSTDTYLNIMGQYRPSCKVGRITPDNSVAYEEIDRTPTYGEITSAYAAAREAGLWRFDERHL
jgi:putative pyruvate formate lyase activating enzyme